MANFSQIKRNQFGTRILILLLHQQQPEIPGANGQLRLGVGVNPVPSEAKSIPFRTDAQAGIGAQIGNPADFTPAEQLSGIDG